MNEFLKTIEILFQTKKLVEYSCGGVGRANHQQNTKKKKLFNYICGFFESKIATNPKQKSYSFLKE